MSIANSTVGSPTLDPGATLALVESLLGMRFILSRVESVHDA